MDDTTSTSAPDVGHTLAELERTLRATQLELHEAMDGYTSKPIEIDHLFATIDRVVTQSALRNHM